VSGQASVDFRQNQNSHLSGILIAISLLRNDWLTASGKTRQNLFEACSGGSVSRNSCSEQSLPLFVTHVGIRFARLRLSREKFASRNRPPVPMQHIIMRQVPSGHRKPGHRPRRLNSRFIHAGGTWAAKFINGLRDRVADGSSSANHLMQSRHKISRPNHHLSCIAADCESATARQSRVRWDRPCQSESKTS